ncbi:hypothetical protein NEMBOFW57_010851 [Staphylotrichum longicolle]|uniref:Uncharacterized protein n=1 Tax=Staphylotrichum longicolle TaxID=669026 RepID=A0AAD4HV47_9PEZI|nr:hypothetical protein NEMBOFW57_010851 [Staphylotrichum longicolle]
MGFFDGLRAVTQNLSQGVRTKAQQMIKERLSAQLEGKFPVQRSGSGLTKSIADAATTTQEKNVERKF